MGGRGEMLEENEFSFLDLCNFSLEHNSCINWGVPTCINALNLAL